MHIRKRGWLRLYIAISLLWLLAVSAWAASEWHSQVPYGYFVETVIGPPNGILQYPAVRQFRVMQSATILLAPLIGLGLLGCLGLWVALGFKRVEP
jgi:hypothetical protein